MGFSQGDFIRSEKVELKGKLSETNFFTWEITLSYRLLREHRQKDFCHA